MRTLPRGAVIVSGLALALALAAPACRAQITLEGQTFDDRATVAGQPLVLNGAGLREIGRAHV